MSDVDRSSTGTDGAADAATLLEAYRSLKHNPELAPGVALYLADHLLMTDLFVEADAWYAWNGGSGMARCKRCLVAASNFGPSRSGLWPGSSP